MAINLQSQPDPNLTHARVLLPYEIEDDTVIIVPGPNGTRHNRRLAYRWAINGQSEQATRYADYDGAGVATVYGSEYVGLFFQVDAPQTDTIYAYLFGICELTLEYWSVEIDPAGAQIEGSHATTDPITVINAVPDSGLLFGSDPFDTSPVKWLTNSHRVVVAKDGHAQRSIVLESGGNYAVKVEYYQLQLDPNGGTELVKYDERTTPIAQSAGIVRVPLGDDSPIHDPAEFRGARRTLAYITRDGARYSINLELVAGGKCVTEELYYLSRLGSWYTLPIERTVAVEDGNDYVVTAHIGDRLGKRKQHITRAPVRTYEARTDLLHTDGQANHLDAARAGAYYLLRNGVILPIIVSELRWEYPEARTNNVPDRLTFRYQLTDLAPARI